jgi:hypothetical protein
MNTSLARSVFVLRPTLVVFLCLVPGACGGGGGSGGGSTLDQGDYSASDFAYASPQPTGFHPLESEETLLTPRAESFAILPNAGTGRLPTARFLTDGPDASFADLPQGSAVFGANLRSACAGQLDEDGDQELVGALIPSAGTSLELWLADPRADGGFDEEFLTALPVSGFLLNEARVTLANLDDDAAPEYLVVGRSLAFEQRATRGRVWVLDDREHGLTQLMLEARDAEHVNLWALPADLAGDGLPEIVVALAGDSTHDGRLAVRTFRRSSGGASFTRVHGWVYFYESTSRESCKAVVGDFDGDRRDEIAALGFDQAGTTLLTILSMGLSDSDTWTPETSELWSGPGIGWAVRGREWAACAVAKSGAPDEVAVVYPVPPFGQMTLYVHAYDAGTGDWSRVEVGTHQALADDLGVTVVGVDDDSDGDEEIVCGFLDRVGSQFVFDQGVVDLGQSFTFERFPTRTVPSPEAVDSLPVIVPFDLDGDGLRVRSTGVRRIGLATPIPLVLMHAPPTRAGIGQNFGASQSEYTLASSSGESFGVTTQATVSASLGVEGEDFTGAFGAHAKLTIAAALAATTLTTTQVTEIDSFTGSFADDVLVFQGTLYEAYEYEVLSSPTPGLVGQLVTIDVPVGTRIYNWTVDYYNSVVAAAERIPDTLRTHTVGDPASYPTQSELLAEVAPYVHWQNSGPIPVGQGSGSRTTAIELATEQATEQQTTVSASFEYGFKAGYATSEASVGLEYSEAYTTSYGSATTYSGTVGDILDPAEYEAWRYEWGLAVCNESQLAGPGNQPSGVPGPRPPFQVIRYWTNPNGSAY